MSSDYIQEELALDFGGPTSLVSEWEDALWSRGGIVDLLSDERARQVDKWGEQNHPPFSGVKPDFMRQLYEGRARGLKGMNDGYVAAGTLGWDTILLEEVYEAFEQAGVDDLKYEEELIQVMAVAAAMIEASQRKRRKQNG